MPCHHCALYVMCLLSLVVYKIFFSSLVFSHVTNRTIICLVWVSLCLFCSGFTEILEFVSWYFSSRFVFKYFFLQHILSSPRFPVVIQDPKTTHFFFILLIFLCFSSLVSSCFPLFKCTDLLSYGIQLIANLIQ